MPRPDVSEERRPQILEAAIRVFTRKGYRKTSMSDVAREAGLSVGGVYWYFKSKEEIVKAILGQLFQGDLQSLERLLDDSAPAGARLRVFVADYVRDYDKFGWLNSIGIEFYGEAAHDPQVSGFIQEYLAQYRQALAGLLEQGIRRGEFRPVDSWDTANAILGLEEGLSLLLTADPGNLRWRQSFQIGMELLLIGLTTKEETQ